MPHMLNQGHYAKKAIGFCLALYVAVLLGVVAPAHHHNDGTEHSDCTVCLISHLPIITTLMASFVLIVVRSYVKSVRLPEIISSRKPHASHSRAPPALAVAF